METKRKQRSNKQQIEYLCKYMHDHKDFAAGEFKTSQGAAQIDRQWVQLQAALDELGPHRSVEQWKICWRDQKRKARVEGGAYKKFVNTTGNTDTQIPVLTENSVIVLDTIGKEMALGCGPEESPIGFIPPPSAMTAPVTCTITSAPPTVNFSAPHLPTSNAPAAKPATRRRVRASHPPDRFINAQKELNGLIGELTKELRRSNSLKEEQNYLLSTVGPNKCIMYSARVSGIDTDYPAV